MDAELFCQTYQSTPLLVPILKELHISHWDVFKRRELDGGTVTVKTGFTDISVFPPKRRSFAKAVIAACSRAGYPAISEQEGGKQGARHEIVIITIVPTAFVVRAAHEQQTYNQ